MNDEFYPDAAYFWQIVDDANLSQATIDILKTIERGELARLWAVVQNEIDEADENGHAAGAEFGPNDWDELSLKQTNRRKRLGIGG